MTLLTRREGGVLHLTLSRPERRNAMNRPMVEALRSAFADVEQQPEIRVVVLRGAGGHFCAGGDISEMAAALGQPMTADGGDPLVTLNRGFGAMLQAVESSHAAVIAICEGGVMGGGFGLACVADVTLAVEGAHFRLPETSLGITPAQIAPFVVRRIGLSQARRLAVTGETLTASQSLAYDLAHAYVQPDGIDDWLAETLKSIMRCEPGAVAATKRLMLAASSADTLGPLLDRAAADFAALARGTAATAGFQAFMQRRAPPWSEEL
jgi:isohexenylglutaconyl-CoA hydratase